MSRSWTMPEAGDHSSRRPAIVALVQQLDVREESWHISWQRVKGWNDDSCIVKLQLLLGLTFILLLHTEPSVCALAVTTETKHPTTNVNPLLSHQSSHWISWAVTPWPPGYGGFPEPGISLALCGSLLRRSGRSRRRKSRRRCWRRRKRKTRRRSSHSRRS